MARPQVFFSFSSLDREIVRRLLARLNDQPIQVWNYSDEAEEIPGGDPLRQHLRARITACAFFLPLISAHSLQSPHTHFEVECALERQAQGGLRIVPLVTEGSPPAAEWPAPYKRLTDLRYREVDLRSRISQESVLLSLCADMGLRYTPLLWSDPRLPFIDRFMQELQGRIAQSKERDIAVYSRLMRILVEFEELYASDDFACALSRITYFVACCENEYPSVRLYYPSIVKVVTEVACGEDEQALVTLRRLSDHPDRDENYFGLEGYIHQQAGRYSEALRCYREAVKQAPGDPAARAGVALNAILAGERMDVDAVFRDIEQGRIQVAEDRAKVRALKARALLSANRLGEAEAEYAALIREGIIETPVLLNYAHTLIRQNRQSEARRLLEQQYGDNIDNDTLHLLASLTSRTGDLRGALKRYEELVGRRPQSRQYRIEAACVARALGDQVRAHELAADLLDRTRFPLPAVPDDFYYDGLANWILGRRERAEYDFERSGRPRNEHYREMVG